MNHSSRKMLWGFLVIAMLLPGAIAKELQVYILAG